MLIAATESKTVLIVLMVVLIVFVVLLAVLGVVFIIALRKRAPVVKVVMAPSKEEIEEAKRAISDDSNSFAAAGDTAEEKSESVAEDTDEFITQDLTDDEEDDDEEEAVYVKEGQSKVRYDRSFEAKLIQLKDEPKEWYTAIKNELMSYKKVKARISWKRESFAMGRMKLARMVIRGKTLCLMLAVDPAGYTGTKYTVEDVSNVASSADTPCMYRIKSARRAQYAIEMIQAIMKEIGDDKQPNFEAKDYYLPYEGIMSLIQRGLVKRVVSGTQKVFKIQEVDPSEAATAEQGEKGDK